MYFFPYCDTFSLLVTQSWSQINNQKRLTTSSQTAQSSRSTPNSNHDNSKLVRPQSSPTFRRVDMDKQLFPIAEMSSHSGLDSHQYEQSNNNSHHHYPNQQSNNSSSNGHNQFYQNNSKTAETETPNINSESLNFGSCLSSPLDIGKQGSEYSKGDLKNRPKSSNLRRLPLLLHVLDAAEIRKTIQ